MFFIEAFENLDINANKSVKSLVRKLHFFISNLNSIDYKYDFYLDMNISYIIIYTDIRVKMYYD
jgi:hypothetical protein